MEVQELKALRYIFYSILKNNTPTIYLCLPTLMCFPHNFKLYLTIGPVTRKGYGSIAIEAKTNGLLTRAHCVQKGLIVLVSPT